jgi:hypothetical protein
MQHVSQSFRMHQAVFDGNIKQLRNSGVWGACHGCGDVRVQRLPDTAAIRIHLRPYRPIRWLVGGQTAIDRIDAKREKSV